MGRAVVAEVRLLTALVMASTALLAPQSASGAASEPAPAVSPAQFGTPASASVGTSAPAGTSGSGSSRAPVLPPAPTGAASAIAVRAALSKTLAGAALAGRAAALVTSADGRTLLQQGAAIPHPPASTAKLLTATAALEVLGPQRRLVTRVVTSATPSAPSTTTQTPSATTATSTPARTPTPGTAPTVSLVLVGGGDATLQSTARPPDLHYPSGDRTPYARLDRLADQLAAAYSHATVRLSVDDSLFSQPRDPDWEPGYIKSGVVAPVDALEVDEGRVRRGSDARAADPALAAGSQLARLLVARGVHVMGRVSRAPVPGGARTVASVTSPPMEDLVERMLTLSDNDLAEALARLTAVAGGYAGDARSANAVVAAVGRLHVSVAGVSLLDGSGLSRRSRIPGRTLAAVLSLALSPAHPELRAVLTGLPVAGATGTLADRYAAPGPAAAGRGLVRGKTGTLTAVTTLAGVVQPRTGPPLVLALLADGVRSTAAARAALDAVAAALAACRCAAPAGGAR